MLGIDFFMHAGLLANLYNRSSELLLSPEEAFRLIPLGYFALLIQTILLFWLIYQLGIQGWRGGAVFGTKLGFLLGSSMFLGLLSISNVETKFLIGWALTQIFEMGIAGGVAGAGLASRTLKSILLKVGAFVIFLLVLTIGLQTLGLMPTLK
jgi:hypothetical protein